MRIHRTQSHGALCLLLALSLQACASQSTGTESGSAVALEQDALKGNTITQPSAAAPSDAPTQPPPPTEEEKIARMEIAHEDIAELGKERQRQYRTAEKTALRGALTVKRAALAEAQANRPARPSAERDALDARIARLKDNIDAHNKKLQDLEAMPD